MAKSPSIQVPSQLLRPHPLVVQLREAGKAAPEDKGVLILDYGRVLRVRASAQHWRRALILMDTLLKLFEARGYAVRIADRGGETELILREGTVSFRLDERTTRTELPPPTPSGAAKRRTGSEPLPSWRPSHVMLGTGEFTLEFGRYRLRGCKSVWRDRPGLRLEAQVEEVVAAIPAWEALLRARRLEEEDRESRAREAETRRLEAAREHEILRRQRALLVDNMRSWERAGRLRRFVAAVAEDWPADGGTIVWLGWAQDQIDALDPLVGDATEVTNLDVTLDAFFSGRPDREKQSKDWWSK